MLYVLIVITSAGGGQTVAMQEFTSKENCMVAANTIKENGRYKGSFAIYSSCVVK
jgi:hypothetical protein